MRRERVLSRSFRQTEQRHGSFVNDQPDSRTERQSGAGRHFRGQLSRNAVDCTRSRSGCVVHDIAGQLFFIFRQLMPEKLFRDPLSCLHRSRLRFATL
jgi:hypothetical protein